MPPFEFNRILSANSLESNTLKFQAATYILMHVLPNNRKILKKWFFVTAGRQWIINNSNKYLYSDFLWNKSKHYRHLEIDWMDIVTLFPKSSKCFTLLWLASCNLLIGITLWSKNKLSRQNLNSKIVKNFTRISYQSHPSSALIDGHSLSSSPW